jgi:integrase
LLGEARTAATNLRGRIFNGDDPAEEKNAVRSTIGDTVGALYDLYKSHREKTKSWTETRRIMEREVLPVWRHLRVVDVKRRTVRELVERKARHAPIMANRILSRISAMLTFAMEQDWIESNPAWRIRQPGEERSRDRVLSRDELRELWAALHETDAKKEDGTRKPRLSQTLNEAFLVMLLTAQRCGEVCKMQWRDVNLDTGWWLIPGTVSKNHDPHRVPLTPMVLDILRRRAPGRRAPTSDTYSRITVRPVWRPAPRRPPPSSARAASPFTFARMTCAAPLPRTWVKPAWIGSTSHTCSITGV